MTDADLPAPQAEAKKKRLSWVWLMPVIAVAVALGMIWQTYANRGPLIVVSFPTATGIEAGQTPLRFRDLDVGRVESIGFSQGLSSIEVGIRLEKSIAPFVDADAQFWLVRPRVSARGISGLNTVLSGEYIEGSWDGVPGDEANRFTALADAPLAAPGEEGTRITLRARSGGQLVSGAPVHFNGVEVGWIGDPVLSQSGLVITRDAFIQAPYDQRLSTASRFWEASGLSVGIDTSGVTFNVESLAALVEGGVAFGTMITGGEPISEGHVFTVFETLEDARTDGLEGGGTQLSVAILMDPLTSGLSTGTTVRYGATKIGEVTAITGYRAPEGSTATAKLLVDMDIIPERMGFDPNLDEDGMLRRLSERVAGGLRVRKTTEGIIGQRAILEFVQIDEAGPEPMMTGLAEAPILPTAPARRAQTNAGIDGLVTRIGDLPIEELMASAIGALDSVQEFAGSPEARRLPANANGLVSDARDLIGGDEIRTAFADFQAAASDLRALSDELRNSPGVASLLTALESSERIGANISTFSERLPAIAEDVEAIADDIQAIPLAELGGSLDSLTKRLDALLYSDGIEDLPASLRDTLDQLSASLKELRDGGAVENLNSTLSSAEGAFAAIEQASQQVPALIERLDGVVVTLRNAASGYAPGSRFEVELTGAIRDVSNAADAFRSLSRTLERNPSALITGR